MTMVPQLAGNERRRAPARLFTWMLAAALTALLSACGGGGYDSWGEGTANAGSSGSTGGSGSPAAEAFSCKPPAEGAQPYPEVQAAVGGVIAGRVDPSFIMLEVPHASKYDSYRVLMYGPDLAAASVISGFIHAGGGYGCSSPDTTAYNGRDYGKNDQVRVYLRTNVGDIDGALTLLDGGSLRYQNVTYGLVHSPLPGIVPTHALVPAVLANAVGSWTLVDRHGVGMSLDVAADGALRLSYRGCALSGKLRVADGGLYTATARHDAASCTNLWQHPMEYEGVALAYPLAKGGWQFVVSLTTNNGFDFDEFLAIGRR